MVHDALIFAPFWSLCPGYFAFPASLWVLFDIEIWFAFFTGLFSVNHWILPLVAFWGRRMGLIGLVTWCSGWWTCLASHFVTWIAVDEGRFDVEVKDGDNDGKKWMGVCWFMWLDKSCDLTKKWLIFFHLVFYDFYYVYYWFIISEWVIGYN